MQKRLNTRRDRVHENFIHHFRKVEVNRLLFTWMDRHLSLLQQNCYRKISIFSGGILLSIPKSFFLPGEQDISSLALCSCQNHWWMLKGILHTCEPWNSRQKPLSMCDGALREKNIVPRRNVYRRFNLK